MLKSDTGENFKASGFKSNGEMLVECDICGLVYILNPIKYPDEILNEYADAVDNDYVSQMPSRIKTFRGSLRQIEKITGVSGGRILDVGAAAGAFVKAAMDAGWHAYGIEPCRFLVKWGRKNLNLGRHLNDGTIDDVKNGTFKVITFWDVLEHTTNPSGTIEKASRLIDRGGFVVINVPDISTLVPRLMGMSWPFYESAHLFYFTPTTLDMLMRVHGFERVYYGKYFQELKLGYLAYRFSQFNGAISRLMVLIFNSLGLSDMPIKYWIGQSLFVYKQVGFKSKNR